MHAEGQKLTKEQTHRQASCDCGQLRFRVTGDPVHVHACTCTQCQGSSGSVMSLSAWFPADAVDIDGEYTVHHHRGPAQPDRYRGFCPSCGTGRFFTSGEAFPGTIAFAAGVFRDPEFPPPDFILYWNDRPRWLAPPTAITLYEQRDE